MTKLLDQPLGVIALNELPDDLPRFGKGSEAMEIKTLCFQYSHEAFGDATTLGLADVRRHDRHPEALHFAEVTRNARAEVAG